MSAIRRLHYKFSNLFLIVAVLSAKIFNFAEEYNISVIARAIGSWQSPALSLITIREIPTVAPLLRNDDMYKKLIAKSEIDKNLTFIQNRR